MNSRNENIQEQDILKDLENKSNEIRAEKNLTLLRYKLNQHLSSYKFLL